MGLSLPFGMTWIYAVVVMYVRGSEGFACNFNDPIMELVVTSCDKDDIITIQGTTDRKIGVEDITGRREVCGIDAVVSSKNII